MGMGTTSEMRPPRMAEAAARRPTSPSLVTPQSVFLVSLLEGVKNSCVSWRTHQTTVFSEPQPAALPASDT